MDKLEQVEKLRERAQVTYNEAKEAYEHADGDLLEALIYLEEQGKVKGPEGGGFYSSEAEQAHEEQTQDGSNGRENNFKETLDKLWKFFAQIIKKGNNTNFEVLKDKENMVNFPVTVLVLLLLFAPWVTLPLMIIGLFFGFHYRFVGVDE